MSKFMVAFALIARVVVLIGLVSAFIEAASGDYAHATYLVALSTLTWITASEVLGAHS